MINVEALLHKLLLTNAVTCNRKKISTRKMFQILLPPVSWASHEHQYSDEDVDGIQVDTNGSIIITTTSITIIKLIKDHNDDDTKVAKKNL